MPFNLSDGPRTGPVDPTVGSARCDLGIGESESAHVLGRRVFSRFERWDTQHPRLRSTTPDRSTSLPLVRHLRRRVVPSLWRCSDGRSHACGATKHYGCCSGSTANDSAPRQSRR